MADNFQKPIRVILSGITGWAGSALAQGIVNQPDLRLVAGVARRAAGRSVGDALGIDAAPGPVVASVTQALVTEADVFFEYSLHDVAKANVMAALDAGLDVVVGTSGSVRRRLFADR